MSFRHEYCSSGILLVDTSKQQIILVKDHSGSYNDFGKVDNEESNSMISSNEYDLCYQKYSDIDIITQYSKYKCYIIRTNGINCKKFFANFIMVKNIITIFYETTSITRFPIQSIKNQYFTNGYIPYYTVSNNGDSCHLNNRIRKVLELAIRNNKI
jgi:hypothetical protein